MYLEITWNEAKDLTNLGLPQREADRLDRLLGWLKDAPLQEHSGADAGGVYAWIDEASGRRPYLYSEITGYFMTLAVQLARARPGEAGYWLHRARAAADWILDVALLPDGALLSRKYPDRAAGADDPYSFENGVSAFFDCAMVGYGLLNVHGFAHERRYLEAAVRLADFCLRAFESPDRRTRYALYGTRQGAPLAPGPRWSSSWGPFAVKCAMFFHTLYRYTGDARYAAFVERITVDALRVQNTAGGFGTGMNRDVVPLHPHNYAVEGLLYLAAHGLRDDLHGTIHRAVDFSFARGMDGDDGPLQQIADNPADRIAGIRSDVLAQSLRTYYVAKLIESRFEWSWERNVERYVQMLDACTLASGGTAYGEDEYGPRRLHANAWCHFFNVEMRLYRQRCLCGTRHTGRIVIT